MPLTARRTAVDYLVWVHRGLEQASGFFKAHSKRLDIFSTEPKRDIDMRRYFEEGGRMRLDGLINPHEIVTRKIPLTRIQEAFALRDNPLSEAIHVLVDCEA